MVTRTETKMVTGKINGLDVTVPAGTTILEAARSAGIEVPNLCYQPLLRPWGSCRICTVEILGKRGGLIESCATPLGEGMEVLTHSEPSVHARQFVLQMYLIDHALDCPTCDKSGECYLQDNTYLNNVNANPYRRPKFTQPYDHFSDLIDYKWDRCIMCNRCTRVCDEMIGVTAIESANRSIEATITPAFGVDLRDTTCTDCGMCIAVCPVGALTDRHFAHHPWELDTTETICGFCDVGCTLNVETNKGVVRRVTNLWERGVNHGYLCYHGKWGHEQVQSPDRIGYPRVHGEGGQIYDVSWEDAIDSIAKTFANYRGDQFAALVSPDSTNEEAYLVQQFTRTVMQTNNVDRYLTPAQAAVERAVRSSLGRDVVNTNNMQELFTDAKCMFVVGPSIGDTEPVASYWFYHARGNREAHLVVISQDDYPLAWRGDLWLKPNPGTTAELLNGIAAQIVELGLAAELPDQPDTFKEWVASFGGNSLESVAASTGVPAEDIRAAAVLYATGGAGLGKADDGAYPPSLIYQTSAHQYGTDWSSGYGDPEVITLACNNLAILTNNLGRPGGGVASLRGPANYQGVTDMGATPAYLPGGVPIEDDAKRAGIAARWRIQASGESDTLAEIPSTPGLSVSELAAAIRSGQIRAMYVEGTVAGRYQALDEDLVDAMSSLDFLVVVDSYDSPLARAAHIVLPWAMSMEKDGTFTNLDRTVQRLRVAVPAAGESQSMVDVIPRLAAALGYEMEHHPAARVMDEISEVVPDYAGVTYARLERGGLNVPVTSFTDPGASVLVPGPDGFATLSPNLVMAAAD